MDNALRLSLRRSAAPSHGKNIGPPELVLGTISMPRHPYGADLCGHRLTGDQARTPLLAHVHFASALTRTLRAG